MKHGKLYCILYNVRNTASISFSLKFDSLPVSLMEQVQAKNLGLLLVPAKEFSISNFSTSLDQVINSESRRCVVLVLQASDHQGAGGGTPDVFKI